AVLRQASDSEVLSVPLAEAERAERELREHFRREFAREGERGQRERPGRPVLLLPSVACEEEVDGEPVEAGPIPTAEKIEDDPQDADVVPEPDADLLPPGVELVPLAEVSDTFRTVYKDSVRARREFTLFRHAQSAAGTA